MRTVVTFKHCAAAAMILTGLCGAASAGEAPAFAADGFSVCVDPTFPPMEFMENAADRDPVGVDIDVAKALAAHWGTEASFVRMDFAGLLSSLEAGRCDAVISGAVLREDRLRSFDGVPYLNTSVVLIAAAGAEPLADLAALSGKTVALQSGTSYAARMEEINAGLEGAGLAPAAVQQYPKQSDAIQQLLVGRAAYVVTQDTEVAYRELQDPGRFVSVFTLPSEQYEPFAIYLRKDEAETTAVAAAVKALVADGTMAGIVEAWKLAPGQLDGIGE